MFFRCNFGGDVLDVRMMKVDRPGRDESAWKVALLFGRSEQFNEAGTTEKKISSTSRRMPTSLH